MTKRQETTLNIYTLIVLNLVFWVCGNIPRRIVNFDGKVSDYTERYINGDFTEAELLWMQSNHYRGAYVKNLAKRQD